MEIKHIITNIIFNYLTYDHHYSLENKKFYEDLAQKILDAIEKEKK